MCTENFMKFGCVIFEICEVDMPYMHADCNSSPTSRGKVINTCNTNIRVYGAVIMAMAMARIHVVHFYEYRLCAD